MQSLQRPSFKRNYESSDNNNNYQQENPNKKKQKASKRPQVSISSTVPLQSSSIIAPTTTNTVISSSGSSSRATTFLNTDILNNYDHDEVIALLQEGVVEPHKVTIYIEKKQLSSGYYPANALDGSHLLNAIYAYNRVYNEPKDSVDAFEEIINELMEYHKIIDEDVATTVASWLVRHFIRVNDSTPRIVVQRKVPIREWLEDRLKHSDFKTLTYSYCSNESPYIKRESALKQYFWYVKSTISREDVKSVSAATLMFIGDCPGVGKSRFAYELPNLLIQEFNQQAKYHFVNLAIWFNCGYKPSENEARNNLITSTAARIIFSYVTFVRPHSYTNRNTQELEELYKHIYEDLKQSIIVDEWTLSNVISWIINRESQYTTLPIWVHLTIDEYNQAFQYITGNSTINNWCEALSNIHYSVNQKHSQNLYTNLLTGTHVNSMLYHHPKGFVGKTYLSRIRVSKFNTEEKYLLFNKMEMPLDMNVLNAYQMMGGHARLCVEFINCYKRTKDVLETLNQLEDIISESLKDRIQLKKDEIEFLLALCFTGYSVRKDYVFNSISILDYQKSDIVFMKEIDSAHIVVDIPLIIIASMLNYISPASFLKKMGSNLNHWQTFNENSDNFEKFNQNLLELKLNCFKKLKEWNIVNWPITINDLFTIDVDFQKYGIQLQNSYASEILTNQYPINNTVPVLPNVIYKNGKLAPFANVFSYLTVGKTNRNNFVNLLCYLKIKHTSESHHLTFEQDISPEFSKLENQKEGCTYFDAFYN